MRVIDEYHKYGLIKVSPNAYQQCVCPSCRGAVKRPEATK